MEGWISSHRECHIRSFPVRQAVQCGGAGKSIAGHKKKKAKDAPASTRLRRSRNSVAECITSEVAFVSKAGMRERLDSSTFWLRSVNVVRHHRKRRWKQMATRNCRMRSVPSASHGTAVCHHRSLSPELHVCTCDMSLRNQKAISDLIASRKKGGTFPFTRFACHGGHSYGDTNFTSLEFSWREGRVASDRAFTTTSQEAGQWF